MAVHTAGPVKDAFLTSANCDLFITMHFFPISSLLLSMKVTERPGRRVCVFCAFMKPDWLNTHSLAVTHKVWPVFMPRVRIEVYAVWNSSCLFQHEAINVLLGATELLQASISPWIRRISFKSKSTTSDHIYLLLVMCLYTDFYAHITSKILNIGKLKTWILPTYKRLPILISPLFSPTFPGTSLSRIWLKKILVIFAVCVSPAVLENLFKSGWWRLEEWYYCECFGPSAPYKLAENVSAFHTFASACRPAGHVVHSLPLAFLLVLHFPHVSQFAAVRWLVAGEWKCRMLQVLPQRFRGVSKVLPFFSGKVCGSG